MKKEINNKKASTYQKIEARWYYKNLMNKIKMEQNKTKQDKKIKDNIT